MTFGEYIEALKTTGLYGKSKVRIVRILFKKAGSCIVRNGSKDELPDSTIYSWTSGSRNCEIAEHFPNDLDCDGLFSYLKTNGIESWKNIQGTFKSYKTANSENANYLIDLETNDPEKFFWSLVNQFCRLLRLPRLESIEENSATPVTRIQKNELSPVELRYIFLQLAECYGIMDIINREPPNFNREDSAYLNIFTRQIVSHIDICHEHNHLLYIFINSFYEQLQIQAFSLDGELNKELGWDNNDTSVYINMDTGDTIKIEVEEDSLDEIEDDEADEIEDDDEDEDDDDYINWDQLNIPELNGELIAQAADQLRLTAIYFEEWEDFCKKMNILYNCISSWQEKTQNA